MKTKDRHENLQWSLKESNKNINFVIPLASNTLKWCVNTICLKIFFTSIVSCVNYQFQKYELLQIDQTLVPV